MKQNETENCKFFRLLEILGLECLSFSINKSWLLVQNFAKSFVFLVNFLVYLYIYCMEPLLIYAQKIQFFGRINFALPKNYVIVF